MFVRIQKLVTVVASKDENLKLGRSVREATSEILNLYHVHITYYNMKHKSNL